LTGRTEEMQTIAAAIADPAVAGIVVHGAAGVGKSRIARDALQAAAAEGCEIRWAVGTSAAKALPLGVLAAWADSSSSDSLELVRGAIESLTAAPPHTPVIVGVDDAHLVDNLSAFVVHQIVQRRAAKVVLTVRDGEPIPDAIQDIWRVAQFDRLDLQPLSIDETSALLAATLAGPLHAEAALRLWRLTRGNALYLRNIVEREIEDGRLALRDGEWQWFGDAVLPPGLVELIDSRMGRLPAAVSDVVDALAVGEPLELGALTRITDAAAIEDADTRGLITLNDFDGRIEVRIAHPLYSEVRRKRAAATRLRRLRGLVATELAACDDRDDIQVLDRRASLSLESDLRPDADLLIKAARGALWLVGVDSSSQLTSAASWGDRLARAAVAAGGGAEAHFIRAYALSWLGHGEDAEEVLENIPHSEVAGADQARRAFLQGFNRLFALKDPEGARRLVDDAAHTVPPGAQGYIEAFRCVYAAAMGAMTAVNAPTYDWDFGRLPDTVAARVTAWAVTVARGEAGRTTEAVATAVAGYPIPMRSFVIITDAHVTALVLAGRIAEAQKVADLLRGRANEALAVTQPYIAVIGAVAGRAALGAGLLREAHSLLHHRLVETYPGMANGWGYRCQISRTMTIAMRGIASEASRAMAALEERRHPAWRYLDYEYALARAWVAAAQEAVSTAVSEALRGAETARRNGQFAAEVMCLQIAAQFGDCSGEARLVDLANIVEGPRAGLAARFAHALSGSDAAELLAVSQDFEEIGDLIAAMDAAAYASLAHREAGRRGSALTCSARANELAHQCGDASTPVLRRAVTSLPLSEREREVAALIGLGLSSSAIAERLTLSVRTVEGHIYRAMGKTGAADREELAAMLFAGHASGREMTPEKIE
jgi:DNA-binding CsgD family transcriptional regulator